MPRSAVRVFARVIWCVVTLAAHFAISHYESVLESRMKPMSHLLLEDNNEHSECAEQTSDDSAFVFFEETKVELFQIA